MPDIDWYHPARGGGRRGPEVSTGAVVSHLPGVRAAVVAQARSIASDAWLQLLFHRKTGAASIEVIAPPTTELDAHVALHDTDPGGQGKGGKNKHKRSAMSIEFGWTTKNGKHVEGLHILQNAIDHAARRYGGS
ncbi:MAG TPA: DUF5403 family protein [Arthrobacter sp.]